MPGETVVVRPKLREANESGVEGVGRNVIGYAAVRSVGCFDQGAQVRKDFWHSLGWKSEDPEDSYGWVHRQNQQVSNRLIKEECPDAGGRKTGNKMAIRWFIPFEANVHRSREPPEVRTRHVASPGLILQEDRARLPRD